MVRIVERIEELGVNLHFLAKHQYMEEGPEVKICNGASQIELRNGDSQQWQDIDTEKQRRIARGRLYVLDHLCALLSGSDLAARNARWRLKGRTCTTTVVAVQITGLLRTAATAGSILEEEPRRGGGGAGTTNRRSHPATAAACSLSKASGVVEPVATNCGRCSPLHLVTWLKLLNLN